MSDKQSVAQTKSRRRSKTVPADEAIEVTQAGKPVGLLGRLAKPQNALSKMNAGLTRVSTNKPSKDIYFRVHPEYFVDLISIINEEGNSKKTYVLTEDVFEQVVCEESINTVLLNRRYYLFVTQGGSYGLWGVTYPMEDGEDLNEWSESANTVIDMAKDTWIRHYAKRGDRGYRTIPASADMGEPKWPNESWEELLEIAFKGKIIDDPEHAIFKKLRGELT